MPRISGKCLAQARMQAPVFPAETRGTPFTTLSGAWSPPMASTAMVGMRLRSLPLEPSPQHWRLDPPHEGLHPVHAQHGNLFTIHGHERRVRVHVDDLQAERHPA